MAAMTAMAMRTYEPWTWMSVLAGLLLFAVTVALLILAARRDNR